MIRRVLICHLSLLAGILCGTCQPGAIARGGEINMRVLQTTQSDTQPYVAIMGQIGRAGVFELPGPVPQLAEFLNLAGGISPNASGSIRLIRGSRSSQFFLSPKLKLQLLPDDLIIVESKQFVAGRPAIVQIGLVNLISRPVVLDIPGEQADPNLAQVLSLLHQPVAGNAKVTVIKPGSGVQTVALEQAFETTLTTGMVLVFDPATVNSAVLPRLPNTIRPGDIADPAITNTSAESEAAQTKISATGPVSRAESPRGGALPVPQLPVPQLPVPRMTLPVASETRSSAASPETVEVTPASPRLAAHPASISDAQSPESLSQSPDFQPLPDATDEKSSEAEPAAPVAQPANSIWSWLLVAGILACCAAVALRLRSSLQPQRVAAPALPQPVAEPENSLELLISGSLPIVEEPLQLPYESEIFGRPRETSPYRTDPAQALSGPHSVPQPGPATTGTVEIPAAVAGEDVPEPANVPVDRKVRVDLRHPRSTVSVLDRALATFQGEQP